MPKIDFKVDKTYLAKEAIANWVAKDGDDTFIKGAAPREHVYAFKSYAEKQDPLSCKFLNTDKLFDVMTLALWYLVTSILIKPNAPDSSDPYGEANQSWLRDLLVDLCNAQVASRFDQNDSFNRYQRSHKNYLRDFEFLSPKFEAYLKSSSSSRQLSEFRRTAMDDLQKLWNENKRM